MSKRRPDRGRWAREEFGSAELGDRRRVRRLDFMGAALLAHGAGTITGAFGSEAKRNAAYDFLSNSAVTLSAIAQAAWNACARRCASSEWVFVPIDGSSLAQTDAFRTRGTGPVGSHTSQGRGFIVMTAIAVSAAGVALGVCGQQFWTRASKEPRKN